MGVTQPIVKPCPFVVAKKMLVGKLKKHWGVDPVRPKRVTEGSWSCYEKEFKDTHAAQWESLLR